MAVSWPRLEARIDGVYSNALERAKWLRWRARRVDPSAASHCHFPSDRLST